MQNIAKFVVVYIYFPGINSIKHFKYVKGQKLISKFQQKLINFLENSNKIK